MVIPMIVAYVEAFGIAHTNYLKLVQAARDHTSSHSHFFGFRPFHVMETKTTDRSDRFDF